MAGFLKIHASDRRINDHPLFIITKQLAALLSCYYNACMRIVFDPGKDGINFEKHDGVLLSQRSIAIDMVYILGRDSTVNMRTKSGRRIRLNTPEEDANITAAAEVDPDVYPYSDAELAGLDPRLERTKGH